MWNSFRNLMRSSSRVLAGAFLMESRNRSTYASSENWYMGSTAARSYSTKYRIAARTEHGRYLSLIHI